MWEISGGTLRTALRKLPLKAWEGKEEPREEGVRIWNENLKEQYQ